MINKSTKNKTLERVVRYKVNKKLHQRLDAKIIQIYSRGIKLSNSNKENSNTLHKSHSRQRYSQQQIKLMSYPFIRSKAKERVQSRDKKYGCPKI